MAIIGRVLEAARLQSRHHRAARLAQHRGFRRRLGAPRLFFGVTGGNMDSMVNRYTADRRVRSDDAYTPGGEGGKRPDRCVIVYSQRMREAYKGVPIVIGGIEASLRRIAHFDYWSDQVRRSRAGRCEGGPAGLRKRRTADGRDRAAARCGRDDRRHHRLARHRVSAARRPGGLGRDRFERARHARAPGSARRSLRRRGGARASARRAAARGSHAWSSSFARCRTPRASAA